MAKTKRERVLELLNEMGVLRPRDLKEIGVSGVYLNKLHAEGVLDRPSRGLYTLADSEPSEHRTIAEACKRVPHAVVCLLSALRYHNLTTQAPFEVWLAIDEKARLPSIDYPPMRFVRSSGAALSFGIEKHDVDGIEVNIYSAAKTVADCFKYRNKIGLDVAIEALRDCLQQRTATLDELWAAAKVCRMSNVMRPYLEAVT
ncbi:transcriptional regulator [bacterium]|nr:transcriptional regulator [bacterium]